MKTKIRGLVFVGFAAAVFAQSALAVDPDDKTVTSKTYVDSKVDAVSGSGTVADPYGDTTITADSPNDKAPSSLNVYKFVTGQVISAGGGVDGNVNYHTDKIGYLDPNWSGINSTGLSSPYMVTKEQLAAHANDQDPWGDHVVKWEIIVPDSRIDKTAASITTSGTSNSTLVQENFPTAKAVYDFVQGGDGTGYQRKLTSAEKASLGVYNADGTSVWKQATGGTYVSISEPANGTTIGFDIDSTKIASHGADDPATNGVDENEIVAGSDKLTTANAVYEYMNGDSGGNGGFQPKATADYANNGLSTPSNQLAQVGVRTGAGTDQNPYVSTWYGLAAGQDGQLIVSNVEDQAYARVFRETRSDDGYGSGVYIDLDHARISVASTYDTSNGGTYVHGGIANVNNYFSAEGMALATAGAVKEYVESVLPNTPDIPVPTDTRCTQAGGTHVCALVAYYDANAGGAGIGGVKYEWTVMAPTN